MHSRLLHFKEITHCSGYLKLVEWVDGFKYVSRFRDNESVFHVSESSLYKAVFKFLKRRSFLHFILQGKKSARFDRIACFIPIWRYVYL